MYVIYLDVLYLINWIMNTFIFYSVTIVLNRHIRWYKMLLSSGLAALIYCMLIILPILQKIPYGIYALVIPIPSILMLFRPKTYRQFFKQYAISMGIATLFGGIVFSSWYNLFGIQRRVNSMSLVFLVGIALSLVCLFRISFCWMKRMFILPVFSYAVYLKRENKRVELRALLDTGNMLYTRESHKPVLVVEYDEVKPLLHKDEQKKYEVFSKSNLDEIEACVIRGDYKMSELIPFNSVGCQNGFLLRMDIEEMEVKQQMKKRQWTPCTIGITSQRLFGDGQFHALLHPDFILEEEKVC